MGQALGRRRETEMRMAQGQIRRLVADHPHGTDGADGRQGPAKIAKSDARHAHDGQNRHPRTAAGLSPRGGKEVRSSEEHTMAAKPQTIDEYLAAVDADKRAALQKLRKAIKAAAPKAQECISYGLAAFRLDGKPLVAFGAAAKHCAFFPMSGNTVSDHKDDLKKYDTNKIGRASCRERGEKQVGQS